MSQTLRARNKKLARAMALLATADTVLVEALRIDEGLNHPVDRMGMGLAEACDLVTAAQRRIEYGLERTRLARRDLDRAIAEEEAAGGPEAYARKRGL